MSEQSERLMNAKAGVLLPAAARAVIALYRPLLDPLHLTHPQFLVLLALENGNAHTVGDIGRRLALSPPTMTPILKRLDALGYVSRPRDLADERRLAVTLTSTGRALIPRLRDIRQQVNDQLGLTDDQRKLLQDFISRMPNTVASYDHLETETESESAQPQ
jgi:DNA-binding MarR family transcriptional regulator